MGDRNLNELLKWSLANSTPAANSSTENDDSNTTTTSAATTNDPNTTAVTIKGDSSGAAPPGATGGGGSRGLPADALAALFGGPSEAELMQESMAAIVSPKISLENKLVAFDNFEQLVESVDNANLLAKLGLWTPLLEQLGNKDAGLRKMAAWCVGTAVQNNEQCQERLLAVGGVEKLCSVATAEEEKKDVRKKAVYALSSAVRNYQPAMDVVAKELEKMGKHPVGKQVDAADMEAVDGVLGTLREEANAAAA
ncbi:hsp70 nucleotide exchange factor fes1 [Zalerion maritima]|uniref:Hsp70 nucleotide exchange factor fes1 n=1 Tax=Zalerion maritima TaxID=339359 RepID=A0AAD5RR96_9PEZI|nr:hsp70 nucleotide exchange factor fes1 [Zalerion maritima]